MNADKPIVHWLGAGLSSAPGIVDLVEHRGNVLLWNRTVEKADRLRHLTGAQSLQTRSLVWDELASTVRPGDVVVSMLPGDLHVQVARLALAAGAHMVTTSYLSPEMEALAHQAAATGVSIVNEVGVDPGIDHLFAHLLVDAARRAGVLGAGRSLDFVSYCGGLPAEPTPFTYKFSWAPLGVLTALGNPARSLNAGVEQLTEKPWTAVERISVRGETFEVYANRDSIPYVAGYGLDKEPGLRTFVRGTLRGAGWKEAWKDIFQRVEAGDMDQLRSLSRELWDAHAYGPEERDRLVLYVALSAAAANGAPAWRACLALDETGSGWQSAMARTVSLTCAQAVGAVLDGRLPKGISTAPSDVAEIRRWLGALEANNIAIHAEGLTI